MAALLPCCPSANRITPVRVLPHAPPPLLNICEPEGCEVSLVRSPLAARKLSLNSEPTAWVKSFRLNRPAKCCKEFREPPDDLNIHDRASRISKKKLALIGTHRVEKGILFYWIAHVGPMSLSIGHRVVISLVCLSISNQRARKL